MTPESMPVIWVGLAILFGIIELVSPGFFFIFLAGGAAIAALIALWSDSIGLQATIFLITSTLLTIFARPILRKTLNIGDRPAVASNVHALIGTEALVLENVDKYSGKVKVIHTGEVWTAYLTQPSEGEILPAGSPAEIVQVDGAKLAVRLKI
jgi:membrane protein implicated in regulation of membrane protease activity